MDQNRNAIEVFIPVKSHVNKYLKKQLNGPIELTMNTGIGNLLYNFFHSPIHKSKYDEIVKRNFPEKYPVSVPAKHAFFEGCQNFTSYSAIIFNNIIDYEIKEGCYMYVAYETNYRNISQREAIEAFMSAYDFSEEDIQFETLRKSIPRIQASRRDKMNPLLWPYRAVHTKTLKDRKNLKLNTPISPCNI